MIPGCVSLSQTPHAPEPMFSQQTPCLHSVANAVKLSFPTEPMISLSVDFSLGVFFPVKGIVTLTDA